ncbi:MAG: hypothetical protein OEM02_07715 [Desulfobulbaceae bacterium]|nr:hypothetical protein [Desulfobulbaceae bacterium]
MGPELLTFVKAEWARVLWKKLQRIIGARAEELNRLRDEFVDPEELARFSVEPHWQIR